MPTPGVYLVNSTGEMTALATEDGEGDTGLLHEALDELGIQHPPEGQYQCDICDHTSDDHTQTCPECGIGQMEETEDDADV